MAGLVAWGEASAAREEEALEQLRNRIEQAMRGLAAAESAHTEAADQLRASETAISEANRSLRALAERQRETRNALRALASDSRKLRDQVETRKAQAGALLRAHYFAGDQRLLKLLLSGDNPNRIARTLAYYRYVYEAQTGLIGQLRGRMDEIDALAQQSRDARTALSELEIGRAHV